MKIVKRYIVLFSLIMMISGNSSGDSITVDGKTFTDVLIYKSPSKYYVKIPKTGKTMNVPLDSVSEDDVSINDDPYYRDKLKAMYQLRKLGKPSNKEVDPAFKVVGGAPQESNVDAGSLFGGGGGGGGKGLGVSQAEVKQLLGAMQLSFSGSGNSVTGKSSDGSVSVSINGAADNVSRIAGTLSGDPAAMQSKGMAMGQVLGRIAPWSGPWLMQNLAKLQQTGKIEKTQNGVKVSITASGDEQTATMNFNISS